MAPDKAINEWDKSQSQVRPHHAMNAGLLDTLSFGVLLLGFIVVRDTIKIVPLEVKQLYEIGSNYANKDYLLDMAGYVLGTVLTVTPEMVDCNNKVILRTADPDGYVGLKTTLDAATIRLEQKRVATIWASRRGEASEQDKRVKVSGKLKTLIIGRPASEREKNYLIELITATLGRLYVSKIEGIVKHGPSASKPAGN